MNKPEIIHPKCPMCDSYRIGRDIDRKEIARLELHIAREAQEPDPDSPGPAFERWRCRAHTAEALAARRLEVLRDLVAACETWGSWEDGVPSGDQQGEMGRVGQAFDRAKRELETP